MARQAVLLAAGSGTRLAPLTDDRPKCLIEVGGRSILDRMLGQLADAGIQTAIIVTGYKSDKLAAHLAANPPRLTVKFAGNPEYATTNNAVSLQCARPFLQDGAFLLCDADVVMRGNPIIDLQRAGASALLMDRRDTLGDEEMKALVENGRVVKLSKELDPKASYGESIGIQKVGADIADLIWDELEQMRSSGRDNAYYEEAFQRLIDKGHPFGVVPIQTGSWTEIDDLADLQDARARFSGD
jgi:choline kinase